jgi:two-component sensor histidine kinase
MIQTIQKFIQENSYEKVLIYGFYLTFIFLICVAIVVDYFTFKYRSMWIEIVALFFIVPVFYAIHKIQDFEKAPYSAWIGAVMIYALIVSSGYAYWNFYFTILIPLMFYTLFPFKASFIQTTLHFIIVGVLMVVGYLNNPNSFLHDPVVVFSFLFSVFFVIAFGIFYHANLENSYNKLYKLNLQNETLLKEVHHRVKNNLNVLASIFGLQSHREDGNTKEILLQNKLKIESMSMVHEMLYYHNDFSKISFDGYARKLFLNISDLFDKKNVKIDIEANGIELPLEVMLKLGLLLNEMFTNSMKYAKNTDELLISVVCKKDESGCILGFSDNGKGEVSIKDLQSSKGIGMKLIKLTAKELDGELTITNENGLKYELKFFQKEKNV